MEYVIPLLAIGYLTAGVWSGLVRRAGERVVQPAGVEPVPTGRVVAPTQALIPAPAVSPEPPLTGPPGRHWQSLVGKRIEAVVTTTHAEDWVRDQVFLIAEDGQHFEIYSDGQIRGSRSLSGFDLFDLLAWPYLGSEVRVYVADAGKQL